MVAQLVLRLRTWPERAILEPSKCMEDAVEFTFGEIKRARPGASGTASTANAVEATQLLHTQRAMTCTKAGHGLGMSRWKIKETGLRNAENFTVFLY